MTTISDVQINRDQSNHYGVCPVCGARGVMRERGINGRDKCENGHMYPSNHAAFKFVSASITGTLDVLNVYSLKADKSRLLNLLRDILYEAQNNPMRLVAFNSPLLGIAMCETWKASHPDATEPELREIERQEYEFRAVVEANRKRENGI